jgi:hypothetical protein
VSITLRELNLVSPALPLTADTFPVITLVANALLSLLMRS